METKDILKQLREKNNYSIKDVANGTKMQYTMCREYESGDRRLGMSAAIKFADFYNVSIDYLLGRPDAKPPDDPVELLAAQYKLGTTEHAIIASYLALPQEDRTKLVDIVERIAKKAEEKKPEITVEKTQYKQVSSSEGDKIFPTTEKPPGIEERLLKTQPTDEDL